ncbi:hypothetical protein CMEL01_14849 [Colletotrichum melonis]|uniref:Uncharacterized protein n=1 Tax=Colletotrichum melonis TaxID=1209925 RepID=A0AAI9UQD4_9PEZI|nr:hypothetical protein CMEL01_14849 [Colletotrichum melonis]
MQQWLGEREAWAIEGHWRGTAAGASAPFSTLRTTAPEYTAGKRAGSQGLAASLGHGNVDSDINMAKYLHFLLTLRGTPGRRSTVVLVGQSDSGECPANGTSSWTPEWYAI